MNVKAYKVESGYNQNLPGKYQVAIKSFPRCGLIVFFAQFESTMPEPKSKIVVHEPDTGEKRTNPKSNMRGKECILAG